MRYIGIDLAWTIKNETGICVLDEYGNILLLSAEVYSNDEIINIIQDFYQYPTIVAIDAPIVVPNETGSRPAESALARDRIHNHRIRAFHCSRSYLTKQYGSIRAEKIAQSLIDAMNFKIGYFEGEDCVVETFPTGIIAGLFPEHAPFKYKIKKGVNTQLAGEELIRLTSLFEENGLLNDLAINTKLKYSRTLHKHLEDQIDAFLCAYTGYSLQYKGTKVLIYGDYSNGFILLPLDEK
ncbi:DUF429 domain-containing protein [Aliicoccus persicus]|uniref:Predicted nuclease (RNAse H fold) n=1 Tax=Aliicoccus persicus TaxID=930138 RepID=A0A662Z4J9_9STAP|nr:DUF429 domain-containing protein [Aliicoccus persicus]SEW12169.1 Predicted nuclease (RNAse H fold) [Aliicoccus persicus]